MLYCSKYNAYVCTEDGAIYREASVREVRRDSIYKEDSCWEGGIYSSIFGQMGMGIDGHRIKKQLI